MKYERLGHKDKKKKSNNSKVWLLNVFFQINEFVVVDIFVLFDWILQS